MRSVHPGNNPSQDRALAEWLSRLVSGINSVFLTIFAETWDDLKFPATAVNPPGQASDPTWDIITPGWRFAPGKTEILHLVGQLPHTYAEGSELRPHIHWTKTSAGVGDVYWQLEVAKASINGVITTFTTTSVTTTVDGTPDTDTTDKHLISAFPSIDGAGLGISDMLIMKLSRIGGDPADTYGADARMLEYDIHVKSRLSGSVKEYKL